MNEAQLSAALKAAHDEYDRGSGCLWTEAVEGLFKRHRRNGSLPVVLGKVGVLNVFYGTQLHFGNTRARRRPWRKTDDAEYRLARWIVSNSSRLDGLLDRGRVDAVRMLESDHPLRTKAGRVRHLYSFATKFAHFHNPRRFPIYDSRAERSLQEVENVLGRRLPNPGRTTGYWYEDWKLDVERVMDLIDVPSYREADKALYTWNGGRWDD